MLAMLDEGVSLRFSQAAHAAGVDPSNLRNWLKRNEIKLLSAEPDRGWRSFSMSDVCVLAVMKPLIDYGMSVADANKIALGIMADDHPAMRDLFFREGETLRFDGDLAVLLWTAPEGWRYTVFSLGRDFPWDLAHCPIVMRLGVMLHDVFQRAMQAS